jgi:ElaB/YqjD/DUF883 family membrane-anchored ribosome-binding protein
MSLKSTAQELIVEDHSALDHPDDHALDQQTGQQVFLVPLEVFDSAQDAGQSVEHVEPSDHMHEDLEPHAELSHHDGDLEVNEPGEISIIIDGLAGVPPGTPEQNLEVVEESDEDKDENKIDENDAKKPKKNEKWDWESKGAPGFIAWVKERCDDVPKHSGYDSAGLDRAVAYLERLDNEISKAMRLDLDGELDADQIEKVRATIDNGIERLQDRLDKVKTHKKSKRKKKADEVTEGMVKEAQKITGVKGVFVTVDLLTSRIARVCINGMVSAGHDIEDLYARQVKEYSLNKREQAQVMQLLSDMGYPLRQDRGYMPDEDLDVASSDNFDWAANYKG